LRTGGEALRAFGGEEVETLTRIGWTPIPAHYTPASDGDREAMEGLDAIVICTAVVYTHGWRAALTARDDILVYEDADNTVYEDSELSGELEYEESYY